MKKRLRPIGGTIVLAVVVVVVVVVVSAVVLGAVARGRKREVGLDNKAGSLLFWCWLLLGRRSLVG